MSVDAMKWAMEEVRGVGGTDKMVLFVLAHHADREGVCWPSIEAIAEKSGKSKRAAQYSLRRLESLELVARIANEGGGRGRRTTYRLALKGAKGATGGAGKGATERQKRVQDRTQKGATDGMPYIEEPSVEQSLEPSLVPAPANPMVTSVVGRFNEAAVERNIVVDARLIARALDEFKHLPDLELEARSCAEWLAVNAPKNGSKPRHAHLTLRTWLGRRQKDQPRRAGHLKANRSQWAQRFGGTNA